MKYRFVSLFITAALCSSPFHFASGAGDDTETSELQLKAVQSYIARTFGVLTTPMSGEELRGSIAAGALWFKNAQEENGHFRYEYVPYEGRYREDDNVVRQAGGLYALGEILRKSDHDVYNLSRTVERSIGYFESLSRTGARDGKGFRCIVRSASSIRCPLGATSLALTGILGYVEHKPSKEREYRELIEDYRTYILAMQKESGGFRDLYSVRGSRLSNAESAFSNGEALLALVRYYAYEKDAEVRSAIDRAFDYLAVQPFDANLYLWIMAAVKDMEALWPHEKYVSYTEKFTEWRIARGSAYKNERRNFCAYAEGLASAVSTLTNSKNKTLTAKLRAELDRLNRNHYALQLTDADVYRIISPKGVPELAVLPDTGRAVGGFLTGDSEPTQRIDFTQHCLGAYTQTLTDVRGEALW